MLELKGGPGVGGKWIFEKVWNWWLRCDGRREMQGNRVRELLGISLCKKKWRMSEERMREGLQAVSFWDFSFCLLFNFLCVPHGYV